MHKLRWKLALFIFTYCPIWIQESIIRDMFSAQINNNFWQYLYYSVKLTPEDHYYGSPIGWYLVATGTFPIWFPCCCIDYFLITTYRSHFPESLI